MSRRPSHLHGLLPVYKRPGPTSHDVVDMARAALRERRIGHTGTLDPMAEGLLLLCVGQATRLQQYLLEWDKVYRGQIRLGHATTTYDREGEPCDPRGEPPQLTSADLERLQAAYVGEIDQLPPPYSAKKVGGKKLYELARSGEPVTLTPKRVSVRRLELGLIDNGLMSVEVEASSGFYVRSLAHDVGCKLGCGGHLHHLERIRIGPYDLASALSQDALTSAKSPDEITLGPAWVALERVRLPFPEVTLKPEAVAHFRHGQEVVLFRPGGEQIAVASQITVRTPDHLLLGVGTVKSVVARGRTLTVRPALVLEQTGP